MTNGHEEAGKDDAGTSAGSVPTGVDPSGHLTVLLVDDQAAVRHLLRESLAGARLRVIGEATVSGAAEAVDQLQPDVVMGDSALLGEVTRRAGPTVGSGPPGRGAGPGRRGPHGLTRREVEVIQLLGQGLTTDEVAQRLFISTKTVKNHLTAIYAKWSVPNRTAATVRAIELNLLPLPDSPNS